MSKVNVFNFFKKEEKFTIIAEGDSFDGILSASNLYVDGSVKTKGTLKVQTLNVSKQGSVIGAIWCGLHIDVYGTIRGNIVCDSISIHENAKVVGNISYTSSLSISEKAKFEGSVKCIRSSAPKEGVVGYDE